MRRSTRHLAAAAVLAALTGACNGGADIPGFSYSAQVTVVQGARSRGTVDVRVDGQLRATVAAASMVPIGIDAGSHTFEVRTAGSTAAGYTRSIVVPTGKVTVLVLFDTTTGLTSSVLSDTGAIAPAGKSKLRVAHFASNAPPIDVWRTQPDFGTPIRVQFPFNYLAVSPYLQSDAGDWRVMVSSAAAGANPPMPDTLANSGLIAIAGTRTRTVVVVDKPGGGVELVVVDP